MTTKLLSPDDLCEVVPGTTKGYWATLRYTGRGPEFMKPSPKVVLYNIDTVMAWLAESTRTQTGESAERVSA